jgi:hypothetical protein
MVKVREEIGLRLNEREGEISCEWFVDEEWWYEFGGRDGILWMSFAHETRPKLCLLQQGS